MIRRAASLALVATLVLASTSLAAGKPGYPDKVTWNGVQWQVKTSTSAVGPGPNILLDTGATVASYTYSGAGVPVPGDERVRLNLWLYGGAAPTNGQAVDVTVESFTFTP